MLQTIEALARLTSLEVFVPNARYPAWASPRSYRYIDAAPHSDSTRDSTARYLSYPSVPLLGRITNGYAAARSLRAPLKAYAPDLILAYWLYPDAFGAGLVARAMKIPLVVGARGSDIRARDRLSLAYTKRVLTHANHVLTVSDDLKRIATESFAVPSRRITTVRNGCDTSIFSLGDKSAARDALGLPGGRLVLYVGRLVAAKGLLELLDAWMQLAVADSSLRLAFVGEGGLREELSRRAQARGFSNRVLLPGISAPAQVANWMRSCNVMCLPSYSEGFPNVLIEALACGRPIVATPVGGIQEIVDSDNGLFAPVRNVDLLATALREVMDRSWDESALSRRYARSWNDVARETFGACRSALGLSDPASTADR
ncbi:MAG: glycosyltransferase [Pseudomonadota bacterium]